VESHQEEGSRGGEAAEGADDVGMEDAILEGPCNIVDHQE